MTRRERERQRERDKEREREGEREEQITEKELLVPGTSRGRNEGTCRRAAIRDVMWTEKVE